jgi:hypothetical protein
MSDLLIIEENIPAFLFEILVIGHRPAHPPEDKWGGEWGVREDRLLNLAMVDNTGGNRYTALLYEKVPLEVAQALDAAMDDGVNNVAKGAGLRL